MPIHTKENWSTVTIPSMHQKFASCTMMRRQKTTPYPNLAWNTPRKSDDLWFDSVLGIRSDSKGVIWILDMGQREGLTPKIVGWNT
ncbi:MAG: hypothetical protein LGB03_06790, partial [Sulfurovum sp.]|nr:hypothetical protein [Sulfurovum sp.]